MSLVALVLAFVAFLIAAAEAFTSLGGISVSGLVALGLALLALAFLLGAGPVARRLP